MGEVAGVGAGGCNWVGRGKRERGGWGLGEYIYIYIIFFLGRILTQELNSRKPHEIKIVPSRSYLAMWLGEEKSELQIRGESITLQSRKGVEPIPQVVSNSSIKIS